MRMIDQHPTDVKHCYSLSMFGYPISFNCKGALLAKKLKVPAIDLLVSVNSLGLRGQLTLYRTALYPNYLLLQ
jgi:hypothetical protein